MVPHQLHNRHQPRLVDLPRAPLLPLTGRPLAVRHLGSPPSMVSTLTLAILLCCGSGVYLSFLMLRLCTHIAKQEGGAGPCCWNPRRSLPRMGDLYPSLMDDGTTNKRMRFPSLVKSGYYGPKDSPQQEQTRVWLKQMLVWVVICVLARACCGLVMYFSTTWFPNALPCACQIGACHRSPPPPSIAGCENFPPRLKCFCPVFCSDRECDQEAVHRLSRHNVGRRHAWRASMWEHYPIRACTFSCRFSHAFRSCCRYPMCGANVETPTHTHSWI